MKKTILVLLGMFFLVNASAIGEGDIITQGQLDNIDPDTFDLQCSYDGWVLRLFPPAIVYKASCLSIEPNGDGNYTVIRPTKNVSITWRWVKDRCFPNFNLFDCKDNHIAPHVTSAFHASKLGIRKTIAKYQTNLGNYDWSINSPL